MTLLQYPLLQPFKGVLQPSKGVLQPIKGRISANRRIVYLMEIAIVLGGSQAPQTRTFWRARRQRGSNLILRPGQSPPRKAPALVKTRIRKMVRRFDDVTYITHNYAIKRVISLVVAPRCQTRCVSFVIPHLPCMLIIVCTQGGGVDLDPPPPAKWSGGGGPP